MESSRWFPVLSRNMLFCYAIAVSEKDLGYAETGARQSVMLTGRGGKREGDRQKFSPLFILLAIEGSRNQPLNE